MKSMLIVFFISLVFFFPSFGQEKPMVVNEEMPSFPGGDSELNKFIQDRIYYPPMPLTQGIEGRVTLRFWIKSNGEVYKPEIVRGLYPELDSIALNVVRQMPRWKTPLSKGNEADVSLYLPIIFRIQDEDYKIFWKPDSLPYFKGKEIAMFKFLRENIKWPAEYAEMAISGRITVRFVVRKDGKIKNPVVVRGLAPLLDKEAIRVVNSMPDWIPAKKDGGNVNAYFILPVVFKLR